MSPYRIPFNRPTIAGNELAYVTQAIAAGQISGDGVFTRKCHALLETELNVRRALLTTSCTHALELAAILLDIKPGDEVILPTFTFVSTANAFVLRGARPVFVDVREDTLNLDERLIEQAITTSTRAIIPVHYGGVGCDMDTIMTAARRHGAAVIEDNAHGLFGRYRGRLLGTFGSMAAQSFHETKNFSCGEGGALIINDPAYIERAEVIREKGTNRSKFFRGEIDKYTWVDVGSSYLPSDALAAFLFGQLEQRENIQRRRSEIWNLYLHELADWAEAQDINLPFVPTHCEQSYHLFYLVLPSLKAREDLIAHLKSQGILAVFHYVPLHTSAMGMRFGGTRGQCPVAERVSDRLLRLPFYNGLTHEEQQFVIAALKTFRINRHTATRG